MARKTPSSRKGADSTNHYNHQGYGRSLDPDVYQELARLQEMIYESFHLPLTRWTVIDEGKLLDQLELIGDHVPEAIDRALAILEKEQEIMADAEGYAQQIVQSAQQQAAQILDQTGIVQQAEYQASQLRLQVQQECEAYQQQTLAEVDQLRRRMTQELEQIRQQALADCDEIQAGADRYADAVLVHLEEQLDDMLRVVRNGREQIRQNSLPDEPPPGNLPEANGH
jgi:cell division septum initiation protein DivIVA